MTDLLRRRLFNQHILRPALAASEDVVRLLGAVQSQDFPGAKWSVGQRLTNGTDAAVEQAFNAGRILRTHVLRPTWHFVTPDDIRWMLDLTAPHVLRANAYQHRELELDAALLRRAHRLFTRALEGGRHLTRAELGGVLADGGIRATGRRLAYIMMDAELTGLVCSGPLHGRHHSYALLAGRAPRARTLPREAALAELALRFFAGHSPATLAHFVWWSNLSVADARRALAMVEAKLEHETIGGTRWFGVSREGARRGPAPALLVPEYDEALVGSKDMAVTDLPRARSKRAWKDAFLRPVLIAGRRAGTWRRTMGRRETLLETNLFASLDAAQSRALEAAAARFGRFLGVPVTLR